MNAVRRAVRRLHGTLAASRRERELTDEIESHLQLHIDEQVRAGVPPDEARRRAALAFGSIEGTKEAYRDRATFPVAGDVARDLRLALRLCRRTPLLTATIVVTVAIAIMVNAVVFTILNAAALQPLHVPMGDRLAAVSIHITGHGSRNIHGAPSMLSYAEYSTLRDESRALDSVAAFAPFNETTLGGSQPGTVLTTLASCNYFDVLGVGTLLGRAFGPSDCAPSAPPTAVLSERFWRSAFNADPAIVGRTIALNRSPFEVIGVAARGFTGTQVVPEDVFVPVTSQRAIARDARLLDDQNMSWLCVIGRRRAAASLSAVRADLDVISGRLTAERHDGRTYALSASAESLSGLPEARTLVIGIGAALSGAVALVLLIACANIANLLLARATARRREMSIRLAIGAGPRRLVQQLLTESLLLAAAGGTLGCVGAGWATRVIVRFLVAHVPPGAWPLVFDPRPDWRVALYGTALTIVTGIAFGLIPAWHATHLGGIGDVRDGGTMERPRARRLQQVLVGTQIAVSIVLVLAAGLLTRGLYRAYTIDPGLSLDRISVVSYDLRGAGYTEAAGAAFQSQALDRLAAIPGVRHVALATTSPLSDQHYETVFVRPETGAQVQLEFSQVTRAYFDVLGLRLVRGRRFSADEEQSERAVIVTASTARHLWPGEDPLTRRLFLDKIERPVVGVVDDAQLSRLGTSDGNFIFLPAGPRSRRPLHALVAWQTGAGTSHALEAAVLALDPQLAVSAAPLAANLEQWRAPSRLVSAIAASLAFVAIVLASIGVFATVSYTVSRRTREIGIRVALGADARRVLRMIVGQGLTPVAIGLFTGLGAAAAVSGLLTSLLFGLSPYSPSTFAAAATLLAAVALVACWLPARRALRVEPAIALREA